MFVETSAPTTVRSPAIATASVNTFGCLVRFALANIRRRPERFVLSVLGIALAKRLARQKRVLSLVFSGVVTIVGAYMMTKSFIG